MGNGERQLIPTHSRMFHLFIRATSASWHKSDELARAILPHFSFRTIPFFETAAAAAVAGEWELLTKGRRGGERTSLFEFRTSPS